MKFSYRSHLTLLLLTTLALPVLATESLQTTPVKLSETVREFHSDGMVEAINRSTVSAQTSGQVEQILFDVDDYVEQGEVLIKLNDTQQKSNLRQAEADLKEAMARLQEATDEYERVSGLFEKKILSESAMDKATAALKSARARQDSASARLVQAGEQFEYTRIKAPYSGIVTARHVQVGEMASMGQMLMSGISLDQLRVKVDVPQKMIASIREQNRASVITPEGEVIEIDEFTVFPYAHQQSNTFTIRLDLPGGVSGLFPGMFIKCSFATGVRQQLVIPGHAVVSRSEVTGVYTVDEDGAVHFRRIRLGHALRNGNVTVISGLMAGEMVANDPIAAGVRLKQQLAEVRHD